MALPDLPGTHLENATLSDGVQLDLGRSARCGFPEVVYGPGKTAEQIVAIFCRQAAAQQPSLATRVSPEQATVVQGTIAERLGTFENPSPVKWNTIARTLHLPTEGRIAELEHNPRVFVVTGGAGDRPVAEEALETLRWMQIPSELLSDVGVAGPQRLLAEVERLRQADALVVVAGMEGALPSVIAGWVDCPVIAIPTSVGYGASFGGLSALLAMLNSCAPHVAVVNIDSGFKGGYLAGLFVSRMTANARTK